MVIQIAGAVVLVTSIICLTWYMTEREKAQAKERKESLSLRESRNKRVFENEAMALYLDEKQRRIAAETKCGILQTQLNEPRKGTDGNNQNQSELKGGK